VNKLNFEETNNIIDIYDDIDKFYKQVSINIKEYRKSLNKSQLSFSADIGFNSVSFYCDCENNKNGKHFNLIHIVRISKYLDIDINKLITNI